MNRWIGKYFALPAYSGAMVVAAVIGNGAEASKLKIEQRVVDDLGSVVLTLSLSMALMSLKLWELLDPAIPMLIILTVQIVIMTAYAYFVIFRFTGRDYNAAVMA